ncbi:MAG: hypothetical protein O2909_04750 [Chloroflexi bacterium]|nr:hypothetical protein [Chloroflexota bacterium]MDA1218733.1 hypothetical protein [Chloroflexota bacterium]PKB58030.1 MAG: hypothetical protein BZY73_00080 [SAR202 cluster bacterium Casp-Chloro-G3]
MAIFIGALLALLSIGVVLYPFLKPGSVLNQTRTFPDQDPEGLDEGPALETIYEAIQTLQLEHQLGNVPLGLYREQLGAYRTQAALALRQQAELPGQDADRVLEQEIMLARASLALSTLDSSNENTVSCPNCGATFGVGLTHCPECSVELGSINRENSSQ